MSRDRRVWLTNRRLIIPKRELEMVSDSDVIAAPPNWPIMLPFGILLLAIAFGPVDRAILQVFAYRSCFSRDSARFSRDSATFAHLLLMFF
jgi:hypothetical protein